MIRMLSIAHIHGTCTEGICFGTLLKPWTAQNPGTVVGGLWPKRAPDEPKSSTDAATLTLDEESVCGAGYVGSSTIRAFSQHFLRSQCRD